MKLFYLATVAGFALVPLVSDAADLKPPVYKAQQAAFVTGGWYMGLGTTGATDKGSISDPVLGTTGSITTAGAGMEAIVGYHNGSHESFKDIELAAAYWNLGGVQNQVIAGAPAAAATLDSRVSGRATLKIGGTQTYANLLAMLGAIGGGNLGLNGVLTPPVNGPTAMPYFAVDVKVNKINASLAGIGAVVADSNSWQVRPGIGMGHYTPITNPVTGVPTGCMADTSLHYYAAGKGIAIGGNGTASFGREFEARMAVVC